MNTNNDEFIQKCSEKEEAIDKAINILFKLDSINLNKLPTHIEDIIKNDFRPTLRIELRDLALNMHSSGQMFSNTDIINSIKLINNICFQCNIILFLYEKKIKENSSFVTRYW